MLLSRLGQLLVDFLIVRFHRILRFRPLLISCLCILAALCISFPLIFVESQNDPVFLFKETSGRATQTFLDLSARFPINQSVNFDLGRVFSVECFGRIIIRAKDGGNLFRPEVFQQIMFLDQLVKDIVVRQGGLDYTYAHLCSKNQGKCHGDKLIPIFAPKISAMSKGIYSIRFPYEVESKAFKFHFLGTNLGEVDLDDNNNVKGAKVAGLIYFLDPGHGDVVVEWQREFLKQLSSHPLDRLELQYFTKELLKDEYFGTLVLVSLLGTLTGAVSLITILTIHRPSKPVIYLILLGGVATSCSGLTGIGIAVFIAGSEFSLLQSGIFLVLLVSSYLDCLHLATVWNKKSYLGAEAVLRDCGPSFLLGLGTVTAPFSLALCVPFKAVRVAAVPWVLATLVHFFFHMVAISLWLSWQQASVTKPSTESILSVNKPLNSVQEKSQFRINWTVFLSVIGLWIGAVTISSWGILNIEPQMDPSYFYRQTSPVYKVVKEEDRYFSDFLYRVHVIVDQPLDYSKPEIQQQIQKLVDHNPYSTDPDLNESWLKYYLIFLKDPRSYLSTFRYDVASSQGFLDCLREVFFKKVPIAQRFVSDVIFNDNFTQIITARFFIQLKGHQNGESARPTYRKLRDYGATFPFRIIFFHFMDPYMDYLENIIWIVMALIGAICFTTMVVVWGIITNFIYSLVFGLGIFGWHICLIGSFRLLGIFLNIPTCLLLILLSGVGIKYGVSVLSCYHSMESFFKFLLSTSLAFLLGSLASLVTKSFVMVTDKIMIFTFFFTLFYLAFLVFPLLFAVKKEKFSNLIRPLIHCFGN